MRKRGRLVLNTAPIEWVAEAMRLSAFPLNEDAALETLHWEQGVGVPPETVSRSAQLPRVIEEGAWNNGRLQVDSQRGQIHWRALSSTPNLNGPMNIGPLPSAIPPFRALMDQWLGTHCPPASRIAFGANLIFPAGSLQEACNHLDGMLPTVSVATDDVHDFMYRINRRRMSRHANSLEINRLATWSVVEGINLEVAIIAGVPSPRPAQVRHFCRLELDINTVPIPGQEIPQEALPAIFGELIDAATEIAMKGDVL